MIIFVQVAVLTHSFYSFAVQVHQSRSHVNSSFVSSFASSSLPQTNIYNKWKKPVYGTSRLKHGLLLQLLHLLLLELHLLELLRGQDLLEEAKLAKSEWGETQHTGH